MTRNPSDGESALRRSTRLRPLAGLMLGVAIGCVPSPVPYEQAVVSVDRRQAEAATDGGSLRLRVSVPSQDRSSEGYGTVLIERTTSRPVKVVTRYKKSMKYFWSPLMIPVALITFPVPVYQCVAKSKACQENMREWGLAFVGFAETVDVPGPRYEYWDVATVEEEEDAAPLVDHVVQYRCGDGSPTMGRTDETGRLPVAVALPRSGAGVRCEFAASVDGSRLVETATMR